MNLYFSKKYNREICELYTGDYYVSKRDDLIMATVLGSCIAVCLFDSQNQIFGMNHFMLPEGRDLNQNARYGTFAMELLINEMMKLKAKRSLLKAKVFGGGNISGGSLGKVAETNIKFILSYLEYEGIPIISQDLGGRTGRKVYFVPPLGDVYIKKLNTVDENNKEEKEYRGRITRLQTFGGNFTLFD